jgi:hypothetical protein
MRGSIQCPSPSPSPITPTITSHHSSQLSTTCSKRRDVGVRVDGDGDVGVDLGARVDGAARSIHNVDDAIAKPSTMLSFAVAVAVAVADHDHDHDHDDTNLS